MKKKKSRHFRQSSLWDLAKKDVVENEALLFGNLGYSRLWPELQQVAVNAGVSQQALQI